MKAARAFDPHVGPAFCAYRFGDPVGLSLPGIGAEADVQRRHRFVAPQRETLAAPVGVVDRGALQSVAAAGHHAGSGYFQSVQRVGDTRQQPYPVVARVVHAGTDFQRVHGRSLIGSVAQVADAVPTAVGHDVRPFGDDPHPFSPVDPARAVCVDLEEMVALLAEGVDRNVNVMDVYDYLGSRPPRGGRG